MYNLRVLIYRNMNANLFVNKSTIILIATFFVSCSNHELERALSLAGENRAELEYVLEHYQNEPMKQKAAQFLIENMTDAYSEDRRITEVCKPFYDSYDSLMLTHGYDSLLRIFDYGKMKLWDKQVDSLWAEYYNISHEKILLDKQYDLQNISAQRLITEIDQAFEVWQSNVYMRDCSFESFCEYILPYRHRNGLLTDSTRQIFRERHEHDFFRQDGKNMIEEMDSLLYRYRHVTHSGFAGTRIPIHTAQTMEKLRHGLCEQRCWFNSLLFSSLGMAVATDFVPAWGNRNNSHTWNVVIKNGKSYAFEAFWDNDRWKYKRIYNNKSCDSIWGRYRLPKVYRRTFQRYTEGPVADNDVDFSDIPPLFKDVRKKDVSSEYFETTDVTINLSSVPKDAKYAYLCVLNYNNWDAVQWGRIADGKATFKDMGRNILYMPMYCKGGIMFQAGEPFVLKTDGTIKTINSTTETETVVINHFSGALAYVKNKEFFKEIVGTLILAKNEQGIFQDTVCCFSDRPELNSISVKSCSNKPTQCVRMYLPHGNVALNGLEFYKRTADGMEKIRNVVIKGSLPDSRNGEHPTAILDEFSATGYAGKIENGYIDFYFGETCVIDEVRYIPYQHCGFETEYEYKLCQWDNGWKEIAHNKGGKPLIFENVPKNSLLIVVPSNNTERVGSRPFIYRNGEVFWL